MPPFVCSPHLPPPLPPVWRAPMMARSQRGQAELPRAPRTDDCGGAKESGVRGRPAASPPCRGPILGMPTALQRVFVTQLPSSVSQQRSTERPQVRYWGYSNKKAVVPARALIWPRRLVMSERSGDGSSPSLQGDCAPGLPLDVLLPRVLQQLSWAAP